MRLKPAFEGKIRVRQTHGYLGIRRRRALIAIPNNPLHWAKVDEGTRRCRASNTGHVRFYF